MLDALSGGRLELGIGKGISPYELKFFGLDPATAAERFQETLEVLQQGFQSDRIDYTGKYFTFDGVPVQQHPVQKPHPPLWYGVIRPDSAAWAARNGMNIICGLGGADEMRGIADAYWGAWNGSVHPGRPQPKVGMMRQIVVADTDAEALAIARRSHKQFRKSFLYLWGRNQDPLGEMLLPEDYDLVEQSGSALAGSPERVLKELSRQLADAGRVNYLLCRFALGDQTHAETVRSVELFARDVMPALRESFAAAA